MCANCVGGGGVKLIGWGKQGERGGVFEERGRWKAGEHAF